MDAIHWFLDGKEDIRSPYYPEDVATEFQVQGLELDWACITWDVDFDILQTVGNAFHLSAAAGITLIKPKGNHILRMLIS